jgi:Na+-translocating ferredoxin:NAD+ oxidoreductase subunit G
MATPSESAEEPGAARTRRTALKAALSLAAFGGIVTIVLFALAQLTRERIDRNEQSWIKAPLYALLEPGSYDNDLLADAIVVSSRDLLGTSAPATIYRARRNGQPVAAVIQTLAPEGYQGPLELLVAVDPDGVLLGVQVLRHNETPGLGDAFETREADWLDAFSGASLLDPPQHLWSVRKDGGAFDAMTGATITSRAIVRGVRRALEFYRAHRERVFTEKSER